MVQYAERLKIFPYQEKKKKKAKSGAKLQFYKDSSGTKSYFEGKNNLTGWLQLPRKGRTDFLTIIKMTDI